MSTDLDRGALRKELLDRISQDFDQVLVAEDDEPDGMRLIFLIPKRLLTPNEVLPICSELVPIISRRIPERMEGWAAGIVVERLHGPAMGCYYLGWAGHAEGWMQYDQSADHADWLALFQRLERLVPPPDHEGRSQGGLILNDEDNGLPRQRLSVHRIEALTADLVANIQQVLKDGYSEWCVEVRLILPEGVPGEGIDIWCDEIVEHWDRPDLKRKLGDRLKI